MPLCWAATALSSPLQPKASADHIPNKLSAAAILTLSCKADAQHDGCFHVHTACRTDAPHVVPRPALNSMCTVASDWLEGLLAPRYGNRTCTSVYLAAAGCTTMVRHNDGVYLCLQKLIKGQMQNSHSSKRARGRTAAVALGRLGWLQGWCCPRCTSPWSGSCRLPHPTGACPYRFVNFAKACSNGSCRLYHPTDKCPHRFVNFAKAGSLRPLW